LKPAPRFFILALIWFFLGCVGFFISQISLIWLLSGLILLPVLIIDAILLLFFTDKLEIKRFISPTLAQGDNDRVKLEITVKGNLLLPSKILLWDIHPPSMDTDAFPVKIKKKDLVDLMNPQIRKSILEYTIIAKERGHWYFHNTELLLSSVLGLWQLKVKKDCLSSIKIYPNFRKIKSMAGMDIRGLLERSGLKNIRMRGNGLEFSSLRDYQEGDSIRAIDWRATSRRQKVIIREYQEEQDQQLLFLLDTGYRLHRYDKAPNEEERLQFDKALEAALLLSWVSLKHGDSVGALGFGGEMNSDAYRWVSPRKGLSSFPLLMNSLYDLHSSSSASSPFSALEEALAKLRRRTFIILISNFREEDGESLSWILKHMERHHLLLLVSIREKESEFLASRKPENTDEALESAAAFSYIVSRQNLYKKWENSGILSLEASAEDLSAALINRYLEVKRTGLL